MREYKISALIISMFILLFSFMSIVLAEEVRDSSVIDDGDVMNYADVMLFGEDTIFQEILEIEEGDKDLSFYAENHGIYSIELYSSGDTTIFDSSGEVLEVVLTENILDFSIEDKENNTVFDESDSKENIELNGNSTYLIKFDSNKILENKIRVTINLIETINETVSLGIIDVTGEDIYFENVLNKVTRDIVFGVTETSNYNIGLLSDSKKLKFSVLYDDGTEYITADEYNADTLVKESIYLVKNNNYILRLPEKESGYNNIKLSLEKQALEVDNGGGSSGGSSSGGTSSGGSSSGGSSSGGSSWESNPYRDAYLNLYDSNGKPYYSAVQYDSNGLPIRDQNTGLVVENIAVTNSSSYKLLYNTEAGSYNGVATSTGGKIPGEYVSFYTGQQQYTVKDSKGNDVTASKSTFSPSLSITISAGTEVIWRDGHGTEQSISNERDYTNNVTGIVVGNNGTVYVETTAFGDDGPRGVLVPLSSLSPEQQALLQPTINNLKKNVDVNADGGTSLGHISKSHSYQTFTNIPPETVVKVSSDDYDISKGIPTSEYLTVYGKAPKALYNIVVRETTIKAWNDPVRIKAHASYSYWCHHYRQRWNSSSKAYVSYCTYHHEARGTVTRDTAYTAYTAQRQKTFYDVVVSDIYKLQSVTVTETNEIYSNYVLEKTINMNGISGPGPDTLSFNLKRPNIQSSYNLDDEGYHGWSYSAAASEAAGSPGSAGKGAVISALNKAINASVQGNVNYYFAGLRVTKTRCIGSPNPGYDEKEDDLLIPQTYPNGKYNPDGYFTYTGYGKVTNNPNPIYVHTPVVNTAKITDTSDYINQKIGADLSKQNYYLMLDEEFTITIPGIGKHRDIKGYSLNNVSKEYNSKQGDSRQGKKATTWGKWEEVKFPFDVYVNGSSGKKYFLPANQWMSAQSWWNTALNDITKWSASKGTQYTFTIPVWVTEKTYSGGEGKSIEVRVVAENAFGDSSIDAVNHLNETGKKQVGTANTDITKYVATQYIDCEIIGKIYDLRVSACNDPGWQDKIYSWEKTQNYVQADEFPFGQPKQNRVTQYKYAPKLGYTFVFDFKTKGRKSNEIKATILPNLSASGFYYVSKDATNGTKVQEVDLYYHSTTKRYEKIETVDPASISVKLNDAYIKVPAQEFVDSNRVYQKESGIKKVYNYNLGVSIGNFTKLTLPHSLRLCYDNFKEYIGKLYGTNATRVSISDNAKVNGATRDLGDGTDNVIGSVGHWYAGYRLPNTTMALPKGANPDNAIKNNSFLKNGYILVKMDLKTVYAQDPTHKWDYLQYTGPEAINEATGDNTGEFVKDENGNPQNWVTPNNNPNTWKDPITLPNGTTVYGPHGTMIIFDADLRASNDAEIGGTH